jgi:soluble lytic murein transglycosylase-like protein
VLACAWLNGIPVQAQVCSGVPGPMTQQAPAERFGLLAEQCASLAGALKPHRAAQLELYDRPPVAVSAAVAAAVAADSEPPADAPDPAGTERRRPAPPTREAARIIALAPAITEIAADFGIDPLLLHAVAHIESRHDAKAVSHAGARGLMQVMPATARRFGVADPERALFDAQVNLRASAAYLQQLRQRYGDDLRLTLAAYNAGEGAVSTYGGVPPYAETQAYVRNVLAVHRRLQDSFSVLPSGQLIERGSRR